MSTPTEHALDRVRQYFLQNPKELAPCVRKAGLRRSTADTALAPGANPTFETIAKLDRVIPADFITQQEAAQ